MKTLLTPSEQRAQAAAGKAVRTQYRSREEIAMRELLEAWCRERFPAARLFHELVVGMGISRADLAAIQPDHLAIFEIKGPHDELERLLHQVVHFRLAAPELWIVVAETFCSAADAIRWLLPSIGVLVVKGFPPPPDRSDLRIEVAAEASRFEPLPEALLNLCWVAELQDEAIAHRLVTPSKRAYRHASLVQAMQALTPAERMAAVCRQLRGRDTMFRADPPP